MFKNSWPLVMFAVTLAASTARAHEIVGNRFFPATLAIDDPGVTDELALPTVSMSVENRRKSFLQATGYLGGIRQTHHRGFCGLDCPHLVASLCTRRSYDEWRTRFPECGDAVQVPTVQECRA